MFLPERCTGMEKNIGRTCHLYMPNYVADFIFIAPNSLVSTRYDGTAGLSISTSFKTNLPDKMEFSPAAFGKLLCVFFDHLDADDYRFVLAHRARRTGNALVGTVECLSFARISILSSGFTKAAIYFRKYSKTGEFLFVFEWIYFIHDNNLYVFR